MADALKAAATVGLSLTRQRVDELTMLLYRDPLAPERKEFSRMIKA